MSSLKTMLPELSASQFSYLYHILDNSLQLNFVQRDALAKLLDLDIQAWIITHRLA